MSEHPSDSPRGGEERVSFTVQSIECIACTPVFRRSLGKVNGVSEVRELPITNKVIVTFDPTKLSRADLQSEIVRVSRRAGFGDRIIFQA